MSLIIDNPEVERLVAEVAAATGEKPDETILRALLDRKERFGMPKTPRTPLSQEDQDEILGYGPDGYCTPSGDFSLTDVKIA